MLRTKLSYFLILAVMPAVAIFALNKIYSGSSDQAQIDTASTQIQQQAPEDEGGLRTQVHPLSIRSLREGEYPGSDIVIEQRLNDGDNFRRYIASYRSEGLKIFGLLTIPDQQVPDKGFPAIIFNHGYIDPDAYKTSERYQEYQAAFARSDYVTFKPDYRGHGNSEGEARGGYGSNDYTIDVLNATSSLKSMEEVDPERIGMWGHSMGGHIALEVMVVNDDIKAGVIWAGVVGSYEDLLMTWRPWWIRRGLPEPTRSEQSPRRRWRETLVDEYGSPRDNPDFWNSISATAFLADISGPLQLHHATADSSVPHELSEKLEQRMIEENKEVELFIYEGDDHNLSGNLSTALRRSVDFFDKYLKG